MTDTAALDTAALDAAVLDRLAQAPCLVVASDFDGTLSAIVSQPEDARPLSRAVEALESLSTLASTVVAVVSGRSLNDLDQLAPMSDRVQRIGSHGLESSSGPPLRLDTRTQQRLHRLIGELESLTKCTPGSRVEIKPSSVAFHYRNADPARAERALAWIDDAIERREGVWSKTGHKVIELLVVPASKAWAIDRLRDSNPGCVVFYAGDDVTDEDVFEHLQPGDVGCKVGDGSTAAAYRVPTPEAIVEALAALAERRAARAARNPTSPNV